MNMARVGVFIDRQTAEQRWNYGLNVFEMQIGEMLTQAGIPFEWVDELHRMSGKLYDIVIAGLVPNHPSAVETLLRYAENGGTIISYSGINVLSKALHCRRIGNGTSGYAHFPEQTELELPPLRYLSADPWRPLTTKEKEDSYSFTTYGQLKSSPEQPDDEASVLPLYYRFAVGKGQIYRWNVNIPHTIVELQQGSGPIMEDGIPAPDGTANVDDGVLKAEDGLTQDWTHVRTQHDCGDSVIAHPYADYWREAAISHLLECATEIAKPLPFIDEWPAGTDCTLMISHDSDRNFDEDAVATLKVLEECGIHSTWCMMKPGYSLHLYEQIKAAGHELALHFNANVREGGSWCEEDFARQWDWLNDLGVADRIVSNKNHFTRFEGWGEFFQWCERCGIEADQTFGPSKSGMVGFPFGTCRPFKPIAWFDEQNRSYNVLEMTFLSQDVPNMTSLQVMPDLLKTVRRERGVAHLVFHQGWLQRSGEVREALKSIVQTAKELGFAVWTGAQINEWERHRRNMRILGMDEQRRVILSDLEQYKNNQTVVCWRPLMKDEALPQNSRSSIRYGRQCVTCKIKK